MAPHYLHEHLPVLPPAKFANLFRRYTRKVIQRLLSTAPLYDIIKIFDTVLGGNEILNTKDKDKIR